MVTQSRQRALFARWFWLVYLPFILLALVLALRFFDFVKLGAPVLLPVSLWAVLAVRLIVERKRRGIGIPFPRSTAFAAGAVVLMAIVGFILLVSGFDSLTTDRGVLMAAAGGFLMILSAVLPLLKFVDALLRAIGRLGRRGLKRMRPPARP